MPKAGMFETIHVSNRFVLPEDFTKSPVKRLPAHWVDIDWTGKNEWNEMVPPSWIDVEIKYTFILVKRYADINFQRKRIDQQAW